MYLFPHFFLFPWITHNSLFYSEFGFALVDSVYGMSNLSKMNLPSLLLFAIVIFPFLRGLFVFSHNDTSVLYTRSEA